MVYKKFITKNGKTYGPYVYHSRRINGKVVSEYQGIDEVKPKKNLLPAIFLSIFLIVAAGFFFFSNYKISGNAILKINGNVINGTLVDGKMSFVLSEGELLPSGSQVVLEHNGSTYTYNLSDLLIGETPSSGNFYLQNSSLSGSGTGFGIPGTKEIFPELSFELQSSNNTPETPAENNPPINQNQNTTGNLNQTSTPEINQTQGNASSNVSATNETASSPVGNVSQNSTTPSETASNTSSATPQTNSTNPPVVNPAQNTSVAPSQTSPQQTSPVNNNQNSGSNASSASSPPTTTETNTQTTTPATTSTSANSPTTTANSQTVQETSSPVTPSTNAPENVQTNTPSTSSATPSNTQTTTPATTGESTQPAAANTQTTPPATSPITGNVIANVFGSFSSFITGLVTGGNPQSNVTNIISGTVSKGNDFSVNSNGLNWEVVPGSVKSNGNSLPDNSVSVTNSNGKVSVQTGYFTTETGYGKDYSGAGTKTFSIDLTKLNETFGEGLLNVKLIYNNNEIASFEENISNQTISEQIQNLTQMFNLTNFSMNTSAIQNLTTIEKQIIMFKLNQSYVNSTVSKYKDKYLVDISIGPYSAEYSYPQVLTDDELNYYIKMDETLFLKDLAKSFQESSPAKTQVGNLSGSFNF